MSNNNNLTEDQKTTRVIENHNKDRKDLVHFHMLPETANYMYGFLTSAREYASSEDAAHRLNIVLAHLKRGLDNFEYNEEDDDDADE